MKVSKAYEQLLDRMEQSRILLSIESLLHWDQETYMPAMGLDMRKKQFQTIACLRQELLLDRNFQKLLHSCIHLKKKKIHPSFSFVERRTLQWIRKDFLISQSLPKEFVKECAKFHTEAISVWAEARKKNDFSLLAPYLQKNIDLSLRKANYIDKHKDPYNVLLDLYEPDMSVQQLDSLFNPLKKKLSTILETILPKRKKCSILRGHFDKKKQMHLFQSLLPLLGFFQEKGRLDLSTHPFSIALHPFDSRITTRIYENHLLEGLSAVLHEVGHGLYEMGLDPSAKDARADTLSLGVHESQSRFYETIIGQSLGFAKFLLPHLKKHFEFDHSAEELFLALNQVEPSCIRVEADEITYSFHIILRYEIEKELLNRSLAVKDLPATWEEKMGNYLGVKPASNQQGCLQDVHWSMGEFGYFPTYSLGNFMAAQLFEAFQKAHSNWEERVAGQDLLFIKDFLFERVHRHGKILTQEELLQNACNTTLSIDSYISYLSNKYNSLYP